MKTKRAAFAVGCPIRKKLKYPRPRATRATLVSLYMRKHLICKSIDPKKVFVFKKGSSQNKEKLERARGDMIFSTLPDLYFQTYL